LRIRKDTSKDLFGYYQELENGGHQMALCKAYFEGSFDLKVQTIIHELSHFFKTEDHGYFRLSDVSEKAIAKGAPPQYSKTFEFPGYFSGGAVMVGDVPIMIGPFDISLNVKLSQKQLLNNADTYAGFCEEVRVKIVNGAFFKDD
jgi:hypothetical protein